MPRNAFIDESQRNGKYLLAAAVVDHGKIDEARRAIRPFVDRGGTRFHFVKENEQRRRQLLQTYSQLPCSYFVVYEDLATGTQIEQRARCLHRLAVELAERGLDTMTLDNMHEATQRRDRQVLLNALRGYTVRYEHAQPKATEPLLWIPDGIAWAAGRGGEWRKLLDGWVTIKQV